MSDKKPISLRKYAAHRKELGLEGASHEAVRRAIAATRLHGAALAYGPGGELLGIADAILADRQWHAFTRWRPGGKYAPVPDDANNWEQDYEQLYRTAEELARAVVAAARDPAAAAKRIMGRVTERGALPEEDRWILCELLEEAAATLTAERAGA